MKKVIKLVLAQVIWLMMLLPVFGNAQITKSNEDSALIASKLQGRFSKQHKYIARKYRQGTEYTYDVYISRYYKKEVPAALLVQLDLFNKEQTAAMEELVQKGLAPPFVAIGVYPGILKSTIAGGSDRYQRVVDYDHVGNEFLNFLVEELIPEAEKVANFSISDNPDMHMISGGSSSGYASFNAAWFRNDFFRRTYLSSPSFVGLAGADDFINYAHKVEPRPIRIYLTFAADEPMGFQGGLYEANIGMVRYLDYSGYDFKYQFYPDKYHVYGLVVYSQELIILKFIWNNWQTEPVKILKYSPDISSIVNIDSYWSEVDAKSFPAKITASVTQGTYEAKGGEIWLTSGNSKGKKVADGFLDISALSVSSDLWRLYIADNKQRYLYAMSINADGSLTNLQKIAPLYLAANSSNIGAKDICIDTEDRIYAATDAGIQILLSTRYIQQIIPLPDDLPADNLAFDGLKLYVRSGKKYFMRVLNKIGRKTGAGISDPADKGLMPSDIFYFDLTGRLPKHPFLLETNKEK